MSLHAYVRDEFGEDVARKLENIRRGGDNNSKGAAFEDFYAAATVCAIAAKHPTALDDFSLSSQELAFVDDLCLRRESAGCKVNYQAKNSSGAAACWDDEIETRFRMQAKIDTEFHGCSISRQVLLVSCNAMAAANDEKIPDDLRESCSSTYFPYATSATKLVHSSEELRDNLKALCKDGNLATIDAAFRCVVSAWVCGSGVRSIGDIIGQAKADSRPNLFRESLQAGLSIPEWLHELGVAFPDLEPRIEAGSIKVSYNGFEISLGASPDEPELNELEGLDDLKSIFVFLMSRSQKDL